MLTGASPLDGLTISEPLQAKARNGSAVTQDRRRLGRLNVVMDHLAFQVLSKTHCWFSNLASLIWCSAPNE
jgi:hypothetical protein